VGVSKILYKQATEGNPSLRTAAELAGTIFPDEVIIHPLGTPATEVEVPVTVDSVVATHGHPVRVDVLP
jgi:hypothetical protein